MPPVSAVVRFGASAYVVVVSALSQWFRRHDKPFTNLVPVPPWRHTTCGHCASCDNWYPDLHDVPIGSTTYKLCDGCKPKVAA
jgi:hypothetical protein